MDSEQFRKAAHSAIDEIIDYYDTLQDRTVLPDVEPGYLKKLLPDGPPETGESWEDIQKDISSKIIPGLTHWQSPNFMAFFPAASTYPAMLAEMYSSAFTAPAFNWICSPAVTELETIVLDWLAQALHLPSCFLSTGEGGGVIQGTASEAVVPVLVAGRDRYLRETTKHYSEEEKEAAIAQKRGRLVALGSEMSHSCAHKAALVAGTKYRSIPAGRKEDFSITGENLRRTLDQCRYDGLEPFFLSLTLGTTATCSVDRFDEIAEVLKDYPLLWTHVDAAYAGAALVCEEYQHLTRHFEAFDSFDMNMHKWLLTNFDASCLYVKRRQDLIEALSVTPSFLRNKFSDSGSVIDYRDWSIPLGRRFRSLKIWFVLRTYGLQGLKSYIRNHVQMGEMFAGLIASRPDLFRILTKPAFALTVFHVVGSTATTSTASAAASNMLHEGFSTDFTPDSDAQATAQANLITKDVYETILSQREIFLTSAVVDGVYAIRVVSANPKADEAHLKRAFKIIVDTTEHILERGRGNSEGVKCQSSKEEINGVGESESAG
ncbi:MAG: hypothetical protein M1823_000529 [Watsoniomyces obsoletus]|nr:MAG: hypothetical protein M1823_000529 [Watsoniomyces obsoletus]